MKVDEFLTQLRIDIDRSTSIPNDYHPHPHSPPVQLKSVLLSHLDLVIQVAEQPEHFRVMSIKSASASWRQVLEVIAKYGLLDKYRDDFELKSDLQKFFIG